MTKDHPSTELLVQIELEQVDLPPRIRKQLIDRLCPIFANIDEQLAELRSAIVLKEKSVAK